MGKHKRKKTESLSDQLRQIIENHELSRYEISKRSGVDASQIHRFMQGATGLSTGSLDRIGAVLGLRLTVEEG